MTNSLLAIASSARGVAAAYVSPITLLVCIVAVPGGVALAVVSYVMYWRKEEEEEEEEEDEEEEGAGETRRRSTRQWYAERFVPCALEGAVLHSIPVSTFSSSGGGGGGGGGGSAQMRCVVCLGAFQAQELLRVLPPCHHPFHAACIDTWFLSHSTCPICRCQVSAPVADQDVCLDVAAI